MTALWSKKLEGDLSQSDCAEMQERVGTCPACSSACDALKRALLACRSSGAAEVPLEVQKRVKAALQSLAARAT